MENMKLPEGYNPSEEEEYMNHLQLEYFRQELLKWKDKLYEESQETIQNLQQHHPCETDLNDRASVEIETNFNLRTRNRYRKLLHKIEEALKRIETEEYGYCEETGEKIGIQRLKARPVATLCLEAQERHEIYEKQHIDKDEEIDEEDN